MACLPDDLEGAVREVIKVYELIKTHQPLLLHHHHHQGHQEPPSTTQFLLGEALRALNIALSVIKQQQQVCRSTASSSLAVRPQPQLLSSSSPAAAASNGARTSTSATSCKRRRPAIEGGKNSSYVKSTPFPYEDSYEWRKYGEKRINGTHFTRSYFRCTYKDDKGCPATKYVQQKDNSDPPMFQVTYNNDHTCNCNNNLPTGGAANNSPPIGHHDGMIINQEATVVLPPLAHVSAIPLDDLMSCDGPFTITDQYATTAAAGDSSCIPGASCDELDMGSIMAEALRGDDPEHLELLCDIIKYC